LIRPINLFKGAYGTSSKNSEFFLKAVLVLIAIGSQIWQPFFLGLHHDDWIQFAYLKADLESQSTQILDRPGFKLVMSLIVRLWNGIPGDLHWFIAIINLLTAGSIYFLILRAQQLFSRRNDLLALSASCFWLLAPWGLAYTLWASAAIGNLALSFFCFSMTCLVTWQIGEFKNWILVFIGALLYSAALTIYQSIWFAFIPIFILMAYEAIKSRITLKKILWAFLIFSFIQAYFIVISILKSPKVKNTNLIHTMIESFLTIPRVLSFSFSSTQVAIYLILFGAALIYYLYRYRVEFFRRHQYFLLIPCLVGLLFSALIYASAGYQFSGSGEPSRTTVMLTFWLAMFLGIAFSASNKYSPLSFIFTVLIIAPGLISYPKGIDPWIQSWNIQSELLARVKGDPFALTLQEGDIIYADVPLRVGPVAIFGAPWDISPALLLTWSIIRPDLIGGFPLKIQIIPPYPTVMSYHYNQHTDMGILTLGKDWEIEGKRLWVWSANSGKYKQITFSQSLSPEIFDDLLR